METRTSLFADSLRRITHAGRSCSPTFFAMFLSLIFAAIVLIARANALTFPLPNEDDAAFFFPAWNLAVHGTVTIPAPEGIFWMPHGLYVWLALFLRIFGPTIQVARTICQLTTATAAVLLVVAYSRLCGSRAFALLCGALLVSPGVIFAANIIRMESLVVLIFATGLLLHSYGRRVAAVATFFLGVVVHPALLLGAVLYAAGVFAAEVILPRYSRSEVTALPMETADRLDRDLVPVGARILTIVVVAAVAGAIAIEGLYVLRHLQTFHQHMAFQIANKARHDPIRSLLARRGLLLIFELVFTSAVTGIAYRHPHARRAFARELLPLFLLALGLSTYATFGREIPYNVYCYAVIPATFFCLAFRLLSLFSQEARTNAGVYGRAASPAQHAA
jgi:hypothetical protein